jgi:RNA polymerase sigma-70 factor (ECF subfamily)
MERTTEAAADVIPLTGGRAVASLEDFEALVRAEQRHIYRVLLLLLRDPDAADSLTQECFFKAYRNRKGFRGDCSPRTWLMRIAVNLARDHVKSPRLRFWRRLFRLSQEGEPILEPADLRATPEQVLLAREKLNAVWSAVDGLPERQRALFLLRFVEEMSIEEISDTVSLRPGTVKAHLFRALSTVRRRIEGADRR